MSPLVAASIVVALVLATVLVIAAWGHVRYARRLPFFRCRIGPPAAVSRRGSRARWCRRRTRAVWVDDVLLVRSGVLRLWVTPFAVGAARAVSLEPADVHGLGPRPVAMRFNLREAGEMEVAVAAEHADRLVGPFLTAALSGLPDAPRERGG